MLLLIRTRIVSKYVVTVYGVSKSWHELSGRNRCHTATTRVSPLVELSSDDGCSFRDDNEN